MHIYFISNIHIYKKKPSVIELTDDNNIPFPSNSKKKKKYGKLTDVNKLLNLRSHNRGEDCRCKRFKCFKHVPETSRRNNIQNFNLLNSVDEQNIYLCGLITTVPIIYKKKFQEKNYHLKKSTN